MDTEFEKILISQYKDAMISYVETHAEAFDEAVQLAISDKQPFSWRSAWLLWSCMKPNDRRLRKHVKSIMKVVKSKEDGHQRELLKILSVMELTENQESMLFDLCVSIWQEINKTPSVRITAFKFLLKIIKKYPGLSHEVIPLTQHHYRETLSPGVCRSVENMLSTLNRL